MEQARANGRKGLESVKTFMRDAKWEAEVLKDIDVFWSSRVSFKDDFPVVGCQLELYIEQQQFVCYFLYRPVVPADRRSAVADFIGRANFGMKVGNFEMSPEGEVRYKSSVGFAGVSLTNVLVYNVVMMGLNSAEPYSAALLDVVQNGKNPADAIRDVEG